MAERDEPVVYEEQALAVQRIVQVFALAAATLVLVLLPATFVEGLGAGLPDGVRVVAGLGLLTGHALASRAPWARLIQTRRGRLLLDVYPLVLLASLVPLPILHGGNQPVFWAIALLLGFGALFTSTRAFALMIALTVGMHAATFARFSDEVDAIGSMSALGSTLLIAAVSRMAGQRFDQAVHEAGRLRRQAETQVEELTELDRLKRDFVSTVSHEIRTPITVILGMAETVEERWEGLHDDDRLDLLRRLRSNASGLEAVISNLLDFAKLERGHVEPALATVDVAELGRDVPARLETMLRDYDLEVHADDTALARADAMLIERVLENLLVNAVRHTPEGTRIEVRVEPRDGRVHVSVADTGPGIGPADLARLGERFFRGGDVMTRATRGVGLGLAFCKEILHMHGSALEVASTEGEGATFWFDLPAASTADGPD